MDDGEVNTGPVISPSGLEDKDEGVQSGDRPQTTKIDSDSDYF